jgi:hypothetical protein
LLECGEDETLKCDDASWRTPGSLCGVLVLSFAAVSAAAQERPRAKPSVAPAPQFGLARLYASSSQKKRALQALDRVVANGLKVAALLRDTPEFASFRQDAHYQEPFSRPGNSP